MVLRPNWVFNSNQSVDIPKGVDKKLHTPAHMVSQAIKNQAICIKTYDEAGFGGIFHWPVPSVELLKDIVAQAHKEKLPVMLHATAMDAYQNGMTAGVDIMAHGVWHWGGDLLDPKVPGSVHELLKSLAKSSISVQPTARVLLGEEESYFGSTLTNSKMRDALPATFLNWLNTKEGKQTQRDIQTLYREKNPLPGTLPEKILKALVLRIKNLLSAYQQHEVGIIFGSDTPSSEGVGNPPGLNGRLEIQAWFDAGIPLAKILKALTIDNAKKFNLEDRIGSVEKGKQADLLILKKNPLKSIHAYDSIQWIILRGKVLERNSLSARHYVK